MARSSWVFAVFTCLVVMTALPQGVTAKNHVVGGDRGWHFSPIVERNPMFYQWWANRDGPYHFGDTLEFNYMPGTTIVRVNEAGYTHCNPTNPLGSYSEGHTIFPLEAPLVHPGARVYFISENRTHCVVGMRFSVDVVV